MLLTVTGALAAVDGTAELAPPLDADGLVVVVLPQAATTRLIRATNVAGLLSFIGCSPPRDGRVDRQASIPGP